jgi:cyclopropane fatty-acyl-phospholipid synthase-like methyltransferase
VPSLAEIHDYYAEMTGSYMRYAAGTGGWHVGLWDADVGTHAQSIVATNRRLLAGLTIDANTHILDVGCGSGALAIWAARTFGCRVTGITIVPLHVAMAQFSAAAARLGHLCDFQIMDMAAMTFPDATFDIVTNQETFCYVEDKLRYLRDVRRVLRPEGAWRTLDGALPERGLSARGERRHRLMCEGYYMFPEPRVRDVEQWLDAAGFHRDPTEDLTALTLPGMRERLQPTPAAVRAIWRRERARNPRWYATQRAHIAASRAVARALIDGEFLYVRYAATTPS